MAISTSAPKVIEDLMLILKSDNNIILISNDEISQEDATAIHSSLYENSLLTGAEM